MQWISKISGTVKTKSEAQAIVTGVIETAQGVWDDMIMFQANHQMKKF